MKRDMDLARQILLKLEHLPAGEEWPRNAMANVDEETLSEDVRMLREAGLIDAIDFSTMDGSEWTPQRLTWSGHEFLEAARNDTVWNKAKALAIEKGVGLTFEILKLALPVIGKQMLGLH